MVETDPRRGIPPGCCPACKATINAAAPIVGPDVRPDPGDFSCCFSCGELLVFDADLSIGRATNAQLNELAQEDPEAYRLLLDASGRIIKDSLRQEDR